MFKILSRLFGREPAPAAQSDSFARLDEVAPLRSAAAAPPGERSFVCREPVLNRGERIAGYEFLLQPHLYTRLAGKSATIRRAYDDALIRSLDSAGVAGLLEHRPAFVGISPVSFDNPVLARLPGANTVLMIEPDAAPAAADLPECLRAARERGFRIGCRLQAQGADDAVLTCKLVHNINSDANGLEREVAAIDQGLLLLGRPLAEVLAAVTVPEGVARALLAGVCGLDAASVNQDLLAALVWTSEVGELGG